MSSQRGNTSRTRSQHHKNKTAFKNNLHDTSHTTKFINSLQINNVCGHCKGVIEWKIKYKKYKPLKSPSTCIKCHNKNVKYAYHTICGECAKKEKACPKCGKQAELVQESSKVSVETVLKSSEIQDMVKALPERKRRTFNRHVEKILEGKETDEPATEEYFLNMLREMNVSSKDSNADFDDFDLESNSESDED